MSDNDLGIQIKILLPTKSNVDWVIKQLKKQFEGKITTNVGISWTQVEVNKKLSEIRTYLKANPLNIPAKLSFLGGEGAIKTQLLGLENRLKKMGMNFGDIQLPSMSNTEKTKRDLDEIAKRYETIIKMADGYTTKKMTSDITSTGVKEKETIIIDETKKAKIEAEKAAQEASKQTTDIIKQEIKTVKELESQYGKLKKIVLRKDANFQTKTKQETFLDESTGVETIRTTGKNQSTTYRVVENLDAIKKKQDQFLIYQQEFKNKLNQLYKSGIIDVTKFKELNAELAKLHYLSSKIDFKNFETRFKELPTFDEYNKEIQRGITLREKAREAEIKFQQIEELRRKRLGERVSGVGAINIEASNMQMRKYAEITAGVGAEVGKVTTKFDSLGNKIKTVDVRVKENGKQWRNYTMTLDQATGGLYKIDKGLSDVRNRQLSMLEQFEIAIKRIPIWMAGMTLFYGSFHQITYAVQYIKDLDREMVNLKKVTDETAESYQRFIQTATQLGRELAKTTVEMVKATTEFAKMGFSLREATELARTALLSANVGDIDINQATQYLIANVKAFNIEAENSIKIIDVLNSLQNQHSTTIEVLGEGLKRTANSMQIANASFEETAAMITAIQAVSQRGGEVIGNAMRTIAMRVRGINEETGELVPQLDKDLSKVGVQLKTVDGEFRNIYEVMRDLSKVWHTLDSFTQADLVEKIAGKRQGEILVTLLTNFAEAEEALVHATDSYGSALRENEIYMDSIEARTKQFQVSLEQLYSTFINSDSILGFISIGQNLINIFTHMTSTIGGLNSVLILIGLTLFTVNTRFREFLLNMTVSPVQAMVIWLNKLSLQLRAVGLSATQATIAIRVLQGAATLGLGLAIGFVLEGVLRLINKIGEHSRKQKDYLNQLTSSTRELTQEISSAESLIDKYAELSKQVNLTATEKAKLSEITQELTNIVPQAVQGYDLEGNALLLNVQVLKEYLALKREELDMQRSNLETQFYTDFQDNIDTLIQKQEELRIKTEQVKKLQDVLTQEPTQRDEYLQKSKILKDELDKLQVEVSELRNETFKLSSESKAQVEAFLMSLDKLGKEDISRIINSIFNSLSKMKDVDVKDLFEDIAINEDIVLNIQEISEVVDEYQKGNVSAEETQKRVNEQLEILRNILLSLNFPVDVVEDFVGAFKFDYVNKNIVTVAKVQEELEKIFEESYKTVSKYNGILRDIEQGNKINIDAVKDLIAVDKDFMQVVELVNGKLKINEKTLYDLITAKKLEYQQTVATANGSIEVLQVQLARELNINVQRIKNIKSVADAYALQAEVLKETFNIEQGYTQSEVSQRQVAVGLFDTRFKTLRELGQLIEEAEKYSNLLSGAGIGNTKSSSKDPLDPYITDLYTQSLAELDHKITELEYNLSQLDKKSLQYRNTQLQIIDVIKQKIILTDQEISRLSVRNQEIQKQLSTMKNFNSLSEKQKKLYNELAKELDDNKMKIIQLDNAVIDFNLTINQLNQSWKDTLKSIADEIISTYKEMYQKQKEVALQELQEEIEKEEERHNDVVDHLNEELDKKRNTTEEQIKLIEELIEAEEKRHKNAIESLDEELSKIQETIDARLKLIDRFSEEEDYNEKLSKAQKERAEIQKQIGLYLMDDSSYAQSKLDELYKQRDEKNKEILQIQSDREKQLRKQNLQDQLQQYQKEIEEKKKAEDKRYELEKNRLEQIKEELQYSLKEYEKYIKSLIEFEKEKFEATKNRLEEEIKETEKYYDDLLMNERAFNKIKESILNGHLSNILSQLSHFKSFVASNMQSIGTVISDNLIDKLTEAENLLDKITGSNYLTSGSETRGNENGSSGSPTSEGYHKNIWGFDWGVTKEGYIYKDGKFVPSSNYQYVPFEIIDMAKRRKAGEFDQGGVADYTGYAMLHGSKKSSEVVFNAEQAKKLYNLIRNLPNDLISSSLNNFVPNMRNLVNFIQPVQPAVSSGDINYNLSLKIDNLNGNRDGAELVFNTLVKGIKKIGGKNRL